MKTIVLSFCALFATHALLAQNWSPINTEETFYYNSGGEELTGIRVDSVAVVEGDTVWYPCRNVQFYPEIESEEFCGVEPLTGTIEAGFLQGRVLKTENGHFHFQYPDTFLIASQTEVGAEWVYSDLFGEEPILATVSEVVEAEVLGMTDSVKTIALSDGRMIQLSKNHGVLSFESLDAVNYSLSGIPDRQLGDYPIGRHEIFDFEEGDVFVYIENYSATSEEYHLLLHRIEITDISQNGNNILEYTYNRARHHRIWQLMGEPGQFYLEEIDPLIGQGTTSAEINLAEPNLYDAVPGTFFFPIDQPNYLDWPPFSYWQDGSFGYRKNVYSDTINSRESKVIGGSLAFSPSLIAAAENFAEYQGPGVADGNVVFQQFDIYPFDDGSMYDIGDTTVLVYTGMDCSDFTSTAAFADGLGTVSSGYFNLLNFSLTAMVGYRKGTEEFGFVPTAAEVVSVGIDENEALPKVTVYPVPTTNELFLTQSDAQTFRIYDISGKPVLRGTLRGETAIDVSNLAAGIYSGHLLRDDQPTGQFRFVKH